MWFTHGFDAHLIQRYYVLTQRIYCGFGRLSIVTKFRLFAAFFCILEVLEYTCMDLSIAVQAALSL